MDAFAEISGAAHSGAAGLNGFAEPTAAQARSGNYRKGRATLHGLRVAIETPQGLRRTGKASGELWSVICHAHYGYLEGTTGADGDAIDVFIGPWPEAQQVYVVNRLRSDGRFDEHKVLMAFTDQDSAVTCYRNSYETGKSGLGSVIPCSIDQLKWWIQFGDHTRPLTADQLPHDGNSTMNEIAWDSAANPVGSTPAKLLYALRRQDAPDGLLLDAVSVRDVLEDADGEDVLDALVIPLNRLERKLGQMQVIMRAASKAVRPTAMQVTPPFKQRGTTNVAGIFELSDGQSITVFFHNPDSTPNRLTPDDEMVSWKWMLNKKDVTIVVAPERGRELNPREVARRLMRLAEANSARFQAANSKRAERMAAIEQGRASIEARQKQLDDLLSEISELEPRVAAKQSQQAATLQSDDRGEVGRTTTTTATPSSPAVVQASADAGALPPGWTESRPGGMATGRDPKNGGIIDQTLATGRWFVIFEDDSIPETGDRFTTRAEAIAAYQAALAARDAAGSQPNSDITRALELIREAKGGVAQLGGSSFFTFDVDGDDAVFDDDMRAKVEALLGEKVKAVVLPGLEGQLSIVPESYAPAPTKVDGAAAAAAAAVVDALYDDGWELVEGSNPDQLRKDGAVAQVAYASDGFVISVTVGGKAATIPGQGSASEMVTKINAAAAPPLAGLPDDVRAYLTTVIDGTADLAAPDVADRLTELYTAHVGNAEFDGLFAKAADAYQAFMIALAQKALG